MDETRRILLEVGASTLEQLAFMFSTPESEDRQMDTEDAVGCRVAFSGPVAGEVTVLISAEALPELASNMLGIDEGDDVEPAQLEDALRETGNIICGNLLPAVFGKEAVFDLMAPEFIATSGVDAVLTSRADEAEITHSPMLSLDDGTFQIFMKTFDRQ